MGKLMVFEKIYEKKEGTAANCTLFTELKHNSKNVQTNLHLSKNTINTIKIII
jgi:hypothetical protein